MSHSILTGATCAFWLFAGAVAAEPFQQFATLCLDTDSDPQAAGARAEAAGWVIVPHDPADAADPGNAELRDPRAYFSVDPQTLGDRAPPEDFAFLLTGWNANGGPFELDDVKVDLCIVVGGDGDPATLAARMEQRLGFAPIDRAGAPTWVFSRRGRGFRPEFALILDDSERARASRERKLYFAAVLDEGGVAGLALGAVRPAD